MHQNLSMPKENSAEAVYAMCTAASDWIETCCEKNAVPDCREPLNQIFTCVRTSWNLANERFFGSGLQMRNDILMFTGGTCSHHQPIDLRQIQTCHEKSEKSHRNKMKIR